MYSETSRQARGVAASRSTLSPVIKIGVMLFLLIRLASYIYHAFYGLLVAVPIDNLLHGLHVGPLAEVRNVLLGLAVTPLSFAVVGVLAPFIGWWIYSKIEPDRQDIVGWGATGLQAALDLALMLWNHRSVANAGLDLPLVAVLIGEAVFVFYTMFFMGIGFNIAKLLRIKL